ncbi:Qat anti-phage system TatD family nuclease QatD [Acidisphaera sp. S103]|uniref:Qat anti-phage system TatD family nuclease QatD n=1 Tax=Acidisphaera sp. S103 TaxID=1747223 RepID=UPI00131B41A3|nr:Qat anti-phage system TatD family nuclease QatD [Acidisphaera sp. S103]
MSGKLIDFHCHLDLYPDFERQVSDCDRHEIYTLAVTTLPAAWPRNRDFAAATKHVRAGLGLHPQIVEERWREIDAWERYLPEARYIGEVGLDAGPRHYRSLQRQKDVFRRILEACASEGGRILSVHSVRAASKVLDMIEENLPSGRGKVCLHWFTGSEREAQRAVKLGCYFSVNIEMLRKEHGLKLVSRLPMGRLLTETDGPFTTMDGRPLRPADSEMVLRELATVRKLSVEEMRSVLLANLKGVTSRSITSEVAGL